MRLMSSLSGEGCVAVYTDGAKAITGHVRVMIGLTREVNSNILFTNCIIRREARASKELSSGVMVVMNHVVKIKVVNSIKSKSKAICLFKALCKKMGEVHEHLLHSEVRWLSRGNVLSRVFELKDERATFLSENPVLVQSFVQSSFLVKVAYLANVFEDFNMLNRSLQGKQVTVVSAADQIGAFCSNLQSWTSA